MLDRNKELLPLRNRNQTRLRMNDLGNETSACSASHIDFRKNRHKLAQRRNRNLPSREQRRNHNLRPQEQLRIRSQK